MSTVAMVSGMMPIVLGWGADPSFRTSMAVVVVGGLITSTFLSLFVIPVVYSYLDDAVQEVRLRVRASSYDPVAIRPVELLP